MAQSEYDRVKAWLDRAPRELLVRLLWDQALSNDEFFERLSDHVTVAQSSDGDSAIDLMIRTALTVDGFLDYYAMRPFVRVAQQVADLLASHLTGEGDMATLPLAQLAMKMGIEDYKKGDDSSGRFGEILQLMAATHLEAATGAQPDPVAFAEDLFELCIIDEWRFFPFYSYHLEEATSSIVRILLVEGDPLAALNEARAGLYDSHLWFDIAEALEPLNATEAVRIYQERIDDIIKIKGNRAYNRAADLVRHIRKLMTQLHRQEEFLPWPGYGAASA
jgi:hypothetical protein